MSLNLGKLIKLNNRSLDTKLEDNAKNKCDSYVWSGLVIGFLFSFDGGFIHDLRASL